MTYILYSYNVFGLDKFIWVNLENYSAQSETCIVQSNEGFSKFQFLNGISNFLKFVLRKYFIKILFIETFSNLSPKQQNLHRINELPLITTLLFLFKEKNIFLPQEKNLLNIHFKHQVYELSYLYVVQLLLFFI